MIHSPPVSPVPQKAAQLAGGPKTANPNYVQVINNNTVNTRRVVHRKRADYLVKCGRAEPIGADQIRLIIHDDNVTLQIKAAGGYDSTSGYFELAPAGSDGYTVMQGTRGPGPSEVRPVPHRKSGRQQKARESKSGPPAVRSVHTRAQSATEYAKRIEIVEHIKYGGLRFTQNAL